MSKTDERKDLAAVRYPSKKEKKILAAEAWVVGTTGAGCVVLAMAVPAGGGGLTYRHVLRGPGRGSGLVKAQASTIRSVFDGQ